MIIGIVSTARRSAWLHHNNNKETLDELFF